MLRFASILTVCLLVHSAASGGTVLVTGSGTWDSNAPTTDFSAPSATWSFSFDVTTPISTVDGSATVSNGSYLLKGIPVSESITGVQFGDLSLFGLFSIAFSTSHFVNLYGAVAYDTTTGNLIPGVYPAGIDVDGLSGSPPATTGSGTVTIGAASVPEPSSIISGGIPLVALCGFSLVRRSRVAA